jgi:hypothetical protein
MSTQKKGVVDPNSNAIRDYKSEEVTLPNGKVVLQEEWFDVRKGVVVFASTPIR